MMKKTLAATFMFLFSAAAIIGARAVPGAGFGCDVAGGWPASQYGLMGLLLTDALPCYGITGTRGSPVVLQTAPTITAPAVVSGGSATAFEVGRLGATTPAFVVDTSTGGTTITGITVTAESSGNGVNITAMGETNVPLVVNGAGSGTINFGTASTGDVISFRNFDINHDSTPTLTIGSIGGSLAHVKAPGTSGLAFTTGGGDQVTVLNTASSTRQVTLTGSNGGNPTISTSAGSLAITPAVVGAAGINGSMAANTIKCNNTGSPATSIDCTVPQAQALLASGVITFVATGVNANSANTDTSITITLPTGASKYRMQGVFSYNPSTSLTNATAGVFTGAGGTGTTVVTNVALSALTTNTAGANGSLLAHTVVNVNSAFFNSGTLFYRIGTAQGGAATVDVVIQIVPLA